MENYYFISNEKNGTCYSKWFNTIEDAKMWVENTLDLSLNWTINIK